MGLSVKEIESRVEEIRECRGDDEAAHSMEDNLWREVLQAIADGEYQLHDDCREVARAALKTVDIDFARWCA